MTEAQTRLETVEAIKENTLTVRVSNVLLMGEAMGVDVTTDAARVLRHLAVLENVVRADGDE